MKPLVNSTIRLFLLCIVTLFVVFGTRQANAADNNSTLRLLVVPQFPATEIHATWSKLLDAIQSSELPKIELVFAKDITEFESEFLSGAPDLIYCNPYHMVMAKKAQGYTALVRDNEPLTGILIASKETGPESIQTLDDLNGKTLLFPSPNSFGASLYMRALLTREKGIKFTTKYVKTHPNVIRGVVRNEGQAGGMVASTLATESQELKQKVKIIYETPPTAPHPIAAHPRLSPALQAALSQAILKQIQYNKALGTAIQMGSPVRANYTNDYKPLEKLGLESFLVK